MAKEEVIKKVIVSIATKSDKIEESLRRHSTGRVNTQSSQPPSSTDKKLLPHYLRTSIGSCHDLCKYGHMYVDESIERDASPRKISNSFKIRKEKRPEAPILEESRQIPELKEKKTTSHRKDETFDNPGGEKDSFETSASIKKEESSKELEASEVIFPERCLSIEKIIISEDNVAPLAQSEGSPSQSASMELESPSRIQVLVNQVVDSIALADQFINSKSTTLPSIRKSIASGKASSMNRKTPLQARAGGRATKEKIPLRSLKADTLSKNELSDRVKSIQEKRIESSSKTAIIGNIPRNFEAKSPVSVKKVISMSPRVVNQKGSLFSSTKRIEAPTQPSVSLKPKTPSFKLASSAENNLEIKSSSINKPKASSAFKSSNPRVDRETSSLSLRKSIRLRPSSSPVKKITETDQKVKEKTLYVIESKSVKAESNSLKKESWTSPRASSFSKELNIIKKESTRIPRASSFSTELNIIKKESKSSSPASSISTEMNVVKKESKSSSRASSISTEMNVVKKESKSSSRAASLSPESNVVKKESKRSPRASSFSTELNIIKKESKRSSRASSFSADVNIIKKESKRSSRASSFSTESNTVKKESRRSSRASSFSSSLSSSVDYTVGEGSELVQQKHIRASKLTPPQKMKFQRGKVVSPQFENNAPKRLIFRQARGENEKNSNKEVKRRVLRKRRVSGGSRTELTTAGRSEAPSVSLRRQDALENKDTHTVNFNDVIEETASKLVQTRKSKVKALVGAFETISRYNKFGVL